MMKVLIVKLSSMGDVISTLPAVTDAKKEITDIVFDWVVEENFVEIPRWHPAINSVIPIALRRWRKHLINPATIREILNFWHQLKAKQYDYILDVQGLLKSAMVSRIACGASCGFNAANAREPIATYFYHRNFNIPKKLHAVERSRQLFAAVLGYKISEGNPDYGLAKDTFRQQGNTTKKYLVFIHGTSRNNKCWPEEKWIDLALLAKDAGYQVKLPWGNAQEFARANNIAKVSDNVEVLPKSTLTEVGAILLGAQGVVALDTGLSHLAAALDVPNVSLYGPTDPKLAGTYGRNQTHLVNMEKLCAKDVWQKTPRRS